MYKLSTNGLGTSNTSDIYLLNRIVSSLYNNKDLTINDIVFKTLPKAKKEVKKIAKSYYLESSNYALVNGKYNRNISYDLKKYPDSYNKDNPKIIDRFFYKDPIFTFEGKDEDFCNLIAKQKVVGLEQTFLPDGTPIQTFYDMGYSYFFISIVKTHLSII